MSLKIAFPRSINIQHRVLDDGCRELVMTGTTEKPSSGVHRSIRYKIVYNDTSTQYILRQDENRLNYDSGWRNKYWHSGDMKYSDPQDKEHAKYNDFVNDFIHDIVFINIENKLDTTNVLKEQMDNVASVHIDDGGVWSQHIGNARLDFDKKIEKDELRKKVYSSYDEGKVPYFTVQELYGVNENGGPEYFFDYS